MDLETQDQTQTTLFQALSTLTPIQLRHVTTSISSLLRLHRRRLLAILSSPSLFSLSLRHLRSLSLPQKSLLLARHLIAFLSLLHPLPPPPSTALRHLDSALLLLLLAEVRHVTPNALLLTPLPKWRFFLSSYLYYKAITVASSISVSTSTVLIQYVETVATCRKYIGVMGCGGEGAAGAAAVVGLPSVEVAEGEERECVVCKEVMRVGRDVCELPCGHLFHWGCILPWLRKRDTCPCCRGRLPSDDVAGEIRRLWEAVEKAAAGGKLVI